MLDTLPRIIQGGMGAGVSWWRLARTVSSYGQMGVVSGTAIDLIFARRLQDGDPGGHLRRAMRQFPVPALAERIWKKYFIEGGKGEDKPYKSVPMYSRQPPRDLVELCVLANFVEVFLAREGHSNPVGINFLEKIQMPHLPSIYGAMLAGVSFVLMGAGIPNKIPAILDRYVQHQESTYPLHVRGAQDGADVLMSFDPRSIVPDPVSDLRRPYFLPIISSNVLAEYMIKKSNGRIDGFIIEGPTAGGHNAPPRGKIRLSESGEPIYGERDVVDYAQIRQLGLPFWLAGSAATPERLREVIQIGGAGIQVGTAFAFCEESGMERVYREQLLEKSRQHTARVFTDPRASPTGFPFKVALLENTVSEESLYQERTRICDLGYLREAYQKEGGAVGYRCPSEPVEDYLAKGGPHEETVGRKCLCNALMANIGHPQRRKDGAIENPLITCGDDLVEIARFLEPGKTSYSARHVIETLLQGIDTPEPANRLIHTSTVERV